MNTPRLEVDLRKIRHNTRTIVGRLKGRGIHVTAVTKAVCGHPTIARALLDGGAAGLAEARLSNVKRLRNAGLTCPITLIRTPILGQVDDVVRTCDASYNTEKAVIAALAAAARQRNMVHSIILMVEMGDCREGIMPHDLLDMAQLVMDTPGVVLTGIGANFACLSGIVPTAAKMRALSDLADAVESQCDMFLETVSGGNSANLTWALGQDAKGRIDDLRLGEALLLGVNPITGAQIDGLFQDAFTLFAEIIEIEAGSDCQAVGYADPTLASIKRAPDILAPKPLVLAIGQQDTDVSGLAMPAGATFIGATSDHLVIATKNTTHCVGSEMGFNVNYSALMRAMSAPDVGTHLRNDRQRPDKHGANGPTDQLVLA